MEMIKDALSKIGGPAWRLVQTTKHSTLGAIIVLLVLAAVVWVAI
tara:strand:+ start:495 stop:629 length:135 start_codon:yes stop_codon:yes gene_type:complete